MATALNNVATQNGYAEATTLYSRDSERINLDIANAAIFYQLGDGATQAIIWRPEVFAVPGLRSLDRHADAVRVRSAVAGAPAQVTIEAVPASQIPSSEP